jgi:diguanylate cyclase (GGDEF)-like protein
MEAAFTGWSIETGLWLASAGMACFAAHVMLTLSRGIMSGNRLTAMRALLGAALALSTGCCAAHFIALSRQPQPFALTYSGPLVAGAFLTALAAALAGLTLSASTRQGRRYRTAAAAAFAVCACLTPALALNALKLSPGLAWQVGPVLLGGLAAAVLAAVALAVFPKRRVGSHVMLRHLLASASLGGALVVGNAAVLKGASVPALAASLAEGAVSSGMLFALSTVAVPALLALLLLSSVIESRVRATLKRTRDELLQAAQTDALTRLPNRAMFETRLQRAVARADRGEHRLALLFINLDGLKTVNESFGQSAGDALLCEMAQRLRVMAAPQDLVARAGGDEFLLLLDGDPTREDASTLANRMLKALNEPWAMDEREVTLTCSIGVAMYPEHGALSKLIAHAAAAMHVAKRNGGATYCVFEASMVAGARDQVDLLRDLRRAVQHEELELYYQPKIHAPSGQITGAEALMRWHHPQRGMVGPNIFIPLAERFGLIHAMGNWLIDESCRQIRAWREQGLRMRVSINLSVHQLRQEDLVTRITDAMERNQIEPHVLTCEITETSAMDDTRATLKVIERLAAAGVHLSIDDFGTGYSSLSYLRQLPAGELKIDRSFVLDLETSADARAIVDAVIKLAQALGLKVVAEGVETEEQQKILRQLGCDELQGFLFAKPMSAKALALWAMEDEGPRPLVFRPSLFGDSLSPELA